MRNLKIFLTTFRAKELEKSPDIREPTIGIIKAVFLSLIHFLPISFVIWNWHREIAEIYHVGRNLNQMWGFNLKNLISSYTLDNILIYFIVKVCYLVLSFSQINIKKCLWTRMDAKKLIKKIFENKRWQIFFFRFDSICFSPL